MTREVRLVMSRTSACGPADVRAGDGCQDTATVPIDERTVTDLTSGKGAPVEVRSYG